MASISSIDLISSTDTTMECQAVNLPDDAYYVRWYIGTDAEGSMPFDGYCQKDIDNENWACYTFTGLSPNTTYFVKISVRNANQEALEDAVILSFSTAPSGQGVRPKNWEWESDVEQGVSVEVSVVDGEYYATFLTASEWNSFIDRIFAFATYSKSTLSGTAEDYYVESGDEMMADSVEAARHLIMNMDIDPSYLPAAVSSGDEITAEYINGLKDSLNSIK